LLEPKSLIASSHYSTVSDLVCLSARHCAFSLIHCGFHSSYSGASSLFESQLHFQQYQLKASASTPRPLVLILIAIDPADKIEVSTILAVLIPAMAVTAIPVAQPVADVDAAPVEVEARDLTQA
jgi:hypothetical protein